MDPFDSWFFFSITGLGAVIRNSSGDVVVVGFDVIKCVLPLDIVEAKAIFFSLNMAPRLGVSIGILEYDALFVISLLVKRSTTLSSIGIVLDDIYDILNGFCSGVIFDYVLRGANRVAHSLTKLAFVEECQAVWMNDFPCCL
ncbi:hypothetical protein ACOSQ2_027924 [Xanthoceras sorbifolium]